MAEGSSPAAAQSLRTAQANIKRARDEVEEMLGHLDTARQVSEPRALQDSHPQGQLQTCSRQQRRLCEGTESRGDCCAW